MIDFVDAACANLSQGGMFLVTTHPLLPGTLVKVDIALEVSQVRGVARVVWVRSRPVGPDKPAGMGIRFLSLEPGGIEFIDEAVLRVPPAQSFVPPAAPAIDEPELPPESPHHEILHPAELAHFAAETDATTCPGDPQWRARRLEALIAAQASLYDAPSRADGSAMPIEHRHRDHGAGLLRAFMKLVRGRSP